MKGAQKLLNGWKNDACQANDLELLCDRCKLAREKRAGKYLAEVVNLVQCEIVRHDTCVEGWSAVSRGRVPRNVRKKRGRR